MIITTNSKQDIKLYLNPNKYPVKLDSETLKELEKYKILEIFNIKIRNVH